MAKVPDRPTDCPPFMVIGKTRTGKPEWGNKSVNELTWDETEEILDRLDLQLRTLHDLPKIEKIRRRVHERNPLGTEARVPRNPLATNRHCLEEMTRRDRAQIDAYGISILSEEWRMLQMAMVFFKHGLDHDGWHCLFEWNCYRIEARRKSQSNGFVYYDN